MTAIEYVDFLAMKSHSENNYGFTPKRLPDFLFDFQRSLVEWALQKGRCGIFADCGLGKTPMSLAWADAIVQRENKGVLVLTPLAVSYQTVHEGEKFGIEVRRSQDGISYRGITVTNYARLEYFNPNDFAGVVCDESSILKSFDGALRLQITDFMKKVPYRLLCTATAAPNDYTELGTSSEAVGLLGLTDMLNRFFKNGRNNSGTGRNYGDAPEWRFKGHAEEQFWRWVCSWARAIRKPSDLGFNDGRFVLPPLVENEQYIPSRSLPPGMLFQRPAQGLWEQREERRRTIAERCEHAAAVVSARTKSLVWCNLNDEGDLLERLIPGAVQIKGSDSDDSKEEAFMAFANGKLDRLVTKCSIAGWGLNFQSCDHVALFPSHSFEQYYQGVRRCWRFGQERKVTVDVIATEGDRAVMDNLKRKAKAAADMFTRLVAQMNNALNIRSVASAIKSERIPVWL